MTNVETLVEAGIVDDATHLSTDLIEAIGAAQEEDISALIRLRAADHSKPQPNIW